MFPLPYGRCTRRAYTLIGPEPFDVYDVPTFRVDLRIDPYEIGMSTV